MRFADDVVITVRSGNGGKGCISFRRQRFIPKGGPDGGDGGKGGDVVFCTTKKLFSLNDFVSKKYFVAQDGAPGRGQNQTGKNGEDLVVMVPVGTVITDYDTKQVLVDMTREGQQVTLVPGGMGGKGNQHFATSTNRTPRFAQPGQPGQEKRLGLTLKFIADIGLIGLPNVGKSTLLSRLTSAHPKIDIYPFTTIIPNLGVFFLNDENSLVLADIPGLIQGASQGLGLGHDFLRHIERARALLHLLDITSMSSDCILDDFNTIISEMSAYNPELIKKPQLVLINKIDLKEEATRDVKELQDALAKKGFDSLPISSRTGEGIDALKRFIIDNWLPVYFNQQG